MSQTGPAAVVLPVSPPGPEAASGTPTQPYGHSLNRDYDPEVAAVIRSYSHGQHSPRTPCAPCTLTGGAESGAFLTEVVGSEGADGAATGSPPGGDGGGESKDVDRSAPSFVDSLHAVGERPTSSLTSPVASYLGGETGAARPHTYAADGTRVNPRTHSHSVAETQATTGIVHRTLDTEKVKAILEEKEKRRRDAEAAAAAAKVSQAPVHAVSTDDTAEPVAHTQSMHASSTSMASPDAPWSRPAPPPPPPSQLHKPSQPFTCHEGPHPATSVASVRGDPSRSHPSEAYLSHTSAPYGAASYSLPPLYTHPGSMQVPPYVPMAQASQTAAAAFAPPMIPLEANPYDHYVRYMWNCATYYTQCMASAQACVPAQPSVFAESAHGAMFAPSVQPAYVPMAAQANGSWPSASAGLLATPPSCAYQSGAHSLVMAASQPPPSSVSPSGLVSVLPVTPSVDPAAGANPTATSNYSCHGSLGQSNEASALAMNYVAATSVNSLPDTTADPARPRHRHHSSHAQTPAREPKQKRQAAREAKTSSTAGRSGPTSASVAAREPSRHRGDESGSSTIIPPEMRYSQRNPFSTYEHNKKLAASSTAAAV